VLTGKPHEVKDESSGKVWTAKVSHAEEEKRRRRS
jgi:hypothetical protein